MGDNIEAAYPRGLALALPGLLLAASARPTCRTAAAIHAEVKTAYTISEAQATIQTAASIASRA
jgi:hypothetical protein